MLRLDNISIAFGSAPIFQDVSLHVEAGEICCIQKGVLDGSTSLLKCMAGILDPVGGTCLINGIPLSDYPEDQLVQMVCFCYEDGGLVSLFSVYENIVLPLVYHRSADPVALEARVTRIASALLVADCLHKRVNELNDVQMRLVNLVRALVLESRLVLLDELQEGMSPDMRKAVLGYFLEHCRKKNLTVVMTTTAGDETGFADRLFYIEDKNVREQFDAGI